MKLFYLRSETVSEEISQSIFRRGARRQQQGGEESISNWGVLYALGFGKEKSSQKCAIWQKHWLESVFSKGYRLLFFITLPYKIRNKQLNQNKQKIWSYRLQLDKVMCIGFTNVSSHLENIVPVKILPTSPWHRWIGLYISNTRNSKHSVLGSVFHIFLALVSLLSEVDSFENIKVCIVQLCKYKWSRRYGSWQGDRRFSHRCISKMYE